ncbi:glycine oxidase ThiO [Oceaniferula spumae]|uniref:Glycine oxidase ThiO n=1 Tax=Oceaniferula spumae TaxID=2979115 RepID=A0AAT9FQU9_9BACT
MKTVAVVGAGITGCYTAYFLAKAGWQVELIDRTGVGSQATGSNPGGLNPLHGPGIPGVMSELALRSFALHESLHGEIAESSGIDPQCRVVSRLEIGMDESEVAAMQKSMDLYNATPGFSASWLEPEEILQKEPRLASGAVGGVLMEGNRMVNSPEYARAVAKSAQLLGANIHRAEVTGLKTSSSEVTHVLTSDGEIACDAVVMATGAWFDKASEWLDANLPVRPLKGQLLRAKLSGPELPFHITRGLIGIYQVADGSLWLGGTLEDCGFDGETTQAGRELILQGVSGIFPAIGELEILEQLTGFRPATPDKMPIVGPVPNWNNAFVASGGGPKGMLLSAGLAEVVSSYVLEQELDYSVDHFLPARFSGN